MIAVRVAAYQAPLLAAGSMDALGLIAARVAWCEAEGVTILCCPEAVLGGLADYSEDPCQFAIATDAGRLVFIRRGQAAKVAVQARDCDIAKAVENKMWVIRADVAGRTNGLVSYGSSGIVDPDGMVAQSARELAEDLVVAQIDTVRREKLVR